MDTVATADRSPEVIMHEMGMALEQPYGWTARIGLIALSTDLAIERDFGRLVPSDEVGLFTTRIHLETPNSDRTFLALEDELEAAAKLIIPGSRLDAIVFGCTSASTLIGPARVQARIESGRPGVPCTNPASAALAALDKFAARKIALVTPYTEQMTKNVTRFLLADGLALTSVRSVGFDTDVTIGSISEEVFVQAAMQSDLKDADAIFISCTGTKAVNVIERIECETGLPVVVSNQAAFWHALTLAGWDKAIGGHGRLLREMW
jgi:maleate isomerase